VDEKVSHLYQTWKGEANKSCGDLVVGTLKGYDQLMNLVLDDVKEMLRGEHSMHDPRKGVGC